MKNKNHKIISLSNQENIILFNIVSQFIEDIEKIETIKESLENDKSFYENNSAKLEDYERINIEKDLENIYKKLLHKNNSQSSHLEKLHNFKKENTENKIIQAIEELDKENEKLSLINISKKSNISYTTIKKYKNFIKEKEKELIEEQEKLNTILEKLINK